MNNLNQNACPESPNLGGRSVFLPSDNLGHEGDVPVALWHSGVEQTLPVGTDITTEAVSVATTTCCALSRPYPYIQCYTSVI